MDHSAKLKSTASLFDPSDKDIKKLAAKVKALPREVKEHPLLPIALSAAVPLWIMQIQERGGINDSDIAFCREFSDRLSGPGGEDILFRSKIPGNTAKMFNGLARSIAILSFCPSGVHCFGERWFGNPKDLDDWLESKRIQEECEANDFRTPEQKWQDLKEEYNLG